MPTLLIRLCGPMQSWGTRSRFTERDTELEPSKSGVIGLLCAALGRPRTADVSGLAALKLGVRVDREGTIARDYHTAGGGGTGVLRASGSLSRDAVVSNRYYLAGADFLAGLESPDMGLLKEIESAIRHPTWQLALGRKAFVPAVPVFLPGSGIRDLPLRAALEQEPWPLEPKAWPHPAAGTIARLRLVLEANLGEPGQKEVRMDQPIGAAYVSHARKFGPRAIIQDYIEKEAVHVSQPAPA